MIPEELKKNAYRIMAINRIKDNEFSGSSPPSVFVSHKNYPNVSIAPVAPTEIMQNASFLDSPDEWFGLPLEKFISMRHSLIHSIKKVEVSSARDPGYDLISLQEIAMSEKPVDLNVSLLKQPSPEVRFSDVLAPIGPIAPLKKFSFSSNPKISQKIDYLASDTDAKANISVLELYAHGISVSSLAKLLSVGILGVKKNRKLVPTKWSITAVDDNVCKHLINEKIKYFPEISEIQLFSSSYLDNNFFILLLPSCWSFEMLECWLKYGFNGQESNPNILVDYEFFEGRKKYADQITGAYYAARLAIAEHLFEKKKQASALIFREIGEEYSIPVGVWEIRENVRNALQQKPLTFFSLELALQFLEKKLSVPMRFYNAKSKLLDLQKNQKKITAFL